MVEGWQEGLANFFRTPLAGMSARGVSRYRRSRIARFPPLSFASRESLVSFALSPVRITHPLLDTGIESFRDLSHYQAATTE